jgi:hypothetical protein
LTTYQLLGNDVEVVPTALPNLWRVTNCFSTETFEWMSQAVLNQNNQWYRPTDCLSFRLQLTLESETYHRASLLRDNLTDLMKKITGMQELKIVLNRFWLDLPSFKCLPHSDSDFLAVTYQVYLWGHGNVPGTVFCESSDATEDNLGNQIEIPFVPNTGYINLNTDQKVHYAKTTEVPRLSACWQWRIREYHSEM